MNKQYLEKASSSSFFLAFEQVASTLKTLTLKKRQFGWQRSLKRSCFLCILPSIDVKIEELPSRGPRQTWLPSAMAEAVLTCAVSAELRRGLADWVAEGGAQGAD